MTMTPLFGYLHEQWTTLISFSLGVLMLLLNVCVPSTVVHYSNISVAEAKEILKGSHRSLAVTYAFRLIMGAGFYSEGLLLSAVRTERMQNCKRAVIRAMKQRMGKNLRKKNLHKTLQLKGMPQDDTMDLEKLNVQVTHYVIKELLDLPEDLDLSTVRHVGNIDTDVLLKHGMWDALLCLMGWKEIDDPQVVHAQKYLRDFVYEQKWSEDSFCHDVIAIGKEHGVDARGVLAELLSGMSANITKVLSVLLWKALLGPDCHTIHAELTKAVEDTSHLTDLEFVHLHSKLKDDEAATEGRQKVHKWVDWLLTEYPNLSTAVRQDPTTGKACVVSLKDMAHKSHSPELVFSAGPLGCPGQNLARMAMLLSLRCYFSPESDFCLQPTPTGEDIHTSYHDVVGELEVKFSKGAVRIHKRESPQAKVSQSNIVASQEKTDLPSLLPLVPPNKASLLTKQLSRPLLRKQLSQPLLLTRQLSRRRSISTFPSTAIHFTFQSQFQGQLRAAI